MKSLFQRLLLPGLVFQSINIGGGYGTGREIAEFFLRFGPVGGLLGLLIPATIVVSLGCIVAFELARQTRSYDYRRFLQQLLGRGWIVYEIAYLVAVAMVLAVIGAAIGSIAMQNLNVPEYAGTITLLVVIAYLVFKGTTLIEGVMSAWSLVLYGVYIGIFVLSMMHFGPMLTDAFAREPVESGWLLSGLRYGSLQLSLVPAILFAATHIRSRRDAIIAGALTGPIFLLPAIMFFLAMLPHYPGILAQPVPLTFVLGELQSTVLSVVFPIMLIGTFIETGTGMIHAFNERLATALQSVGRQLPQIGRSITAVALLLSALLMSRFGIIDLVAIGYGALTWTFLAVLVVPLFTVGLWKIRRG